LVVASSVCQLTLATEIYSLGYAMPKVKQPFPLISYAQNGTPVYEPSTTLLAHKNLYLGIRKKKWVRSSRTWTE